MKKPRLFNPHGFTITELMIASALSIMFTASIFSIFFVMQNQVYQERGYVIANQAMRHAMDRIVRDAQEAIAIDVDSATQTLVFKVPSIDADGIPTDFDNDFDYITYELDPGDDTILIRSVTLDAASEREGGENQTDIPVVENISALTFSDDAGNELSDLADDEIEALRYVNVEMESQYLTRGKTQTTSVDATLLLRNMEP